MTTETPELSVEEAQNKLHAARQLRDELEARLKDGDTTISRDELVEAASEVEFGLLRVEGAKANQRRIEDADRMKRADILGAQAREMVASTTREISRSYDSLVKSLSKLAVAVVQHNRSNGEMAARVEELRPSDLSMEAPLPPDLRALVAINGVSVATFSPVRLALAAIHESFSSELAPDRDVNNADATFIRDAATPNLEERRVVKEIAAQAAKESK